MIQFTSYAEQKFDCLNKYKLYYTKEQIEEVLKMPEKSGKKNSYFFSEKDGLKVLYTKHAGTTKVATFYPIK